MSTFEELYESFLQSLQGLWDSLVGYLPTFFGALVVLVIGLIISTFLGKFAGKLVLLLRVDKLSEKLGIKSEIENFGTKLNFASMTEWVVKWFFYIVTLVTVVDILNIRQLSTFLERLVLYLPNVIVAMVILTVGLIVGQFLKEVVGNLLKGFSMTERVANFVCNLAKWSVFAFALMAALVQLGVAADLIQILFTGFVLTVAVAAGLAFGLGGKEHATKVLNWIESELGSKK